MRVLVVILGLYRFLLFMFSRIEFWMCKHFFSSSPIKLFWRVVCWKRQMMSDLSTTTEKLWRFLSKVSFEDFERSFEIWTKTSNSETSEKLWWNFGEKLEHFDEKNLKFSSIELRILIKLSNINKSFLLQQKLLNFPVTFKCLNFNKKKLWFPQVSFKIIV